MTRGLPAAMPPAIPSAPTNAQQQRTTVADHLTGGSRISRLRPAAEASITRIMPGPVLLPPGSKRSVSLSRRPGDRWRAVQWCDAYRRHVAQPPVLGVEWDAVTDRLTRCGW